MMKIAFFDEELQEAASHDAEQAELEELFRIAEKLTDGDLERMKRACEDLKMEKTRGKEND